MRLPPTGATRRLVEGDRILPTAERATPTPTAHAYGNSNYSGYGRAGGDGSKWLGGLSRSGAAPILNHHLLRVDIGLRLSPEPAFELLGITAEAAEQWSATVAAAFHRWAKSKKATRAENMSLYQAQRLVGISQQRDGEYFIRFTYSARKDLLNPLQIGFLDPIQIRGIGVTATGGYAPPFVDGIERDEGGREIAYNVWVLRPDYAYDEKKIPAIGSRSGRRMMVHGYQPEYAGQGRGYSRLSHALQEFENLTDYEASEIKKAIAQSSLNMYVKPSKENVASNPLETISHTAPVGPAGLSAAGAALTAENKIDPADLVQFVPLPEATVGTPGSVGVFSLNEGEDLKAFPNTAPAESFPGFVNALAGHISASLSIPLEVVLMTFSKNYSASRAALMLFWRVALIWRAEMISDFLDPVYENWLAGEIAAGRITAPGWSDPRLREAWLGNSWIGAPMPNIDPMRTAKADQIYAEMGAQDLDRVAQNLNGSSGKANRAKLRRQIRRPIQRQLIDPLTGLGIDLNSASVKYIMTEADKVTGKINAEATIVDADQGIVKYDWQTADVATEGEFPSEFQATLSSSKKITYPPGAPGSGKSYIYVTITADLGE